MVALITDPDLEQALIAKRQAMGVDKYDEVWDGVYIIAPMANDEHQDLVTELATVLTLVVDWTGLGKVRAGVNVSDQERDWHRNYRCPDVVVFLNDTKAENRGAFWFGGPDFAIEVVSRNDRSVEKIPFYARVGVRELMLIDRDPWAITLYRLQGDELVEAGRSSVEDSATIVSEIVPLNWQLQFPDGQPAIHITHHDGQQQWTISPDTA